MCNNCSLRTHVNKNSKNPKRICDDCWGKLPTGGAVIEILTQPEELPTPRAIETLRGEVQMALLTTKATPADETEDAPPAWFKPIRAEDMSMDDVRSQLQSRELNATGTDSELINRLQIALDMEEVIAKHAATNEVFVF